MENLVRILRSIDYIENNLKEPLYLKDIAAEAYFSEFYFGMATPIKTLFSRTYNS